MANEVIIKKSNSLSVESGNIGLPNFKEINLGEEPRKLKIKVENGTRSDGTKFKKVTGYIKLPIYEGIGEEAKYVRDGVKRISVHFRQDAFDDRPETSNISKINDLKSGYLFVKAKGLKIPAVYKINYKKDDKDNIIYDDNGEAKLKYPEIWVECGVLGLLEFVTSQSALDVDDEKEVIDVNEETGEVLEEDYKQFDTSDINEDVETKIE